MKKSERGIRVHPLRLRRLDPRLRVTTTRTGSGHGLSAQERLRRDPRRVHGPATWRRAVPARLVLRGRDGLGVADLKLRGAAGLPAPTGPAAALVTTGGNDLLAGLARDPATRGSSRLVRAARRLPRRACPSRSVLLGNVYDPTFGDDARNFLGIDPRARAGQPQAGQRRPRRRRPPPRPRPRHPRGPARPLPHRRPVLVRQRHRAEPDRRASEVRRAFLPGVLPSGNTPGGAIWAT